MVSVSVNMTAILFVLAATLFVLAVMMYNVMSSKSLDSKKDIKSISRMCLMGYGIPLLVALGVYIASILGFANSAVPILLSILAGIVLGFVLAVPFVAPALLALIPCTPEPATEGKQKEPAPEVKELISSGSVGKGNGAAP